MEKVGRAGRAETSQASSVNIPSQEKKCLSQLSLMVSPKDRYQIGLKVYKNGKLVAEDFVSYPKELLAKDKTEEIILIFAPRHFYLIGSYCLDKIKKEQFFYK